eukprot:m.126853 g.126853  ORF g.126853 m.126853 type:complete len:808 (+) comp22202_c0_seq4:73-2496(+)
MPPAPKPAAPKSLSVRVVVRCRPMSNDESVRKDTSCVTMESESGTALATKGGEPKSFTYDAVYDNNAEQRDIYDETVRPIVADVLNGFNGTIFAYGQTGTGKTWTMEGDRSSVELRGVMPNAFTHIFTEIARTQGKKFLVRASYLEIYKEEIRDLISKASRLKLRQKNDTFYVDGLSSAVVKSAEEIEEIMEIGNKNRMVGSTAMNATSSRSHAIFVVTIECIEVGVDGENHIRVGKLNLVDLAGSERQKKTQATKERLEEGIKINQSLLCLGNVVNALATGAKGDHIPYRNSVLTKLLKDSLGGNAKTVMIANIGPSIYNYDETVNTLRYANRAKNIKNKPTINEDPKDAMLRSFQEQLEKLKSKLSGKRGGKKKRRRKPKFRIDAEGNEVPCSSDDDDGEDDDGDNGVTEEALEKAEYEKQQAELAQERQKMAQDRSLTQQDKERLEADILRREKELEKENRAKAELAEQIKYMEGKLLVGGKNVLDHTTEQERELEQRRLHMVAVRERERKMQQELHEREEKRLEAKNTYVSKQQERDDKTKRLTSLFNRLKEAQREIEDLQNGFGEEREDLMETLDEVQRDLKLRQLIIEHFIPPEAAARTSERAYFDEDADRWRLKPLCAADDSGEGAAEEEEEALPMVSRPIAATPGALHAVTQDACIRAALDSTARYRPDNIHLVDLDMPERTTQDYVAPEVGTHITETLEGALQEEQDLTIDANPEGFLKRAIKKAGRQQQGRGYVSRICATQTCVALPVHSRLSCNPCSPKRDRGRAGSRAQAPPIDKSVHKPESRSKSRQSRGANGP